MRWLLQIACTPAASCLSDIAWSVLMRASFDQICNQVSSVFEVSSHLTMTLAKQMRLAFRLCDCVKFSDYLQPATGEQAHWLYHACMKVARWRTIAYQVCMRAASGQAHPSSSSSLQLRKFISQTIFLLYNIDAPDRDESFGQGAQASSNHDVHSRVCWILTSDLKRHLAHLLVKAHSINNLDIKIHPRFQLQCRFEILSSMGKQHLAPAICNVVCICLH